MIDTADLLQRLATATTPMALFGPLDGDQAAMTATIRQMYRALAPLVHPDQMGDDHQPLAARLNVLRDEALRQIDAGNYGRASADLIEIRAGKNIYTIDAAQVTSGPWAVSYPCTSQHTPDVHMMMVARDPHDASLMDTHVTRLKALADVDEQYRPLFPALIDTFAYRDGTVTRRACVQTGYPLSAWWSLAEVRALRPRDIGGRDMAWIFRRVLMALGVAHDMGIVHGAVVPANILIRPEDHRVVLLDWAASVTTNTPLQLMRVGDHEYYPPEVPRKQPATPATDVYMAASCMHALIEGNMPNIPRKLYAYLRSCVHSQPRMRPENGWQTLRELDSILEQVYGPRVFTPFSMPPR